eukprot:8450599-Pyramimonas_sp.AAC.1
MKARKVRYLTKLVKKAAKLYKPGVLAVGTWGRQVVGLSPTQVQCVRGQAAVCSGVWHAGGLFHCDSWDLWRDSRGPHLPPPS